MAAAVAAASDGAFAVYYRTAGVVDPIRISVREAASVEFKSVAPFRRLRPRRGQRNFVGDWWLATTKRHVTFESWCERDHLIAFDFDPNIISIAGQPRSGGPSLDGRSRSSAHLLLRAATLTRLSCCTPPKPSS